MVTYFIIHISSYRNVAHIGNNIIYKRFRALCNSSKLINCLFQAIIIKYADQSSSIIVSILVNVEVACYHNFIIHFAYYIQNSFNASRNSAFLPLADL